MWHNYPQLIWSPVVEPEVGGEECFLPDQPDELIKKGNFEKVDVIMGCTVCELGAQLCTSKNLSSTISSF